VQAACARAGEVLAGAPLNDGNVDLGQGQLARQHQSRRTSSGDHHRMLGHSHAPAVYVDNNTRISLAPFPYVWLAAGIVRHAPGLPQAPWPHLDVGTVSYQLLRRFYNWFGFTDDAVPYTNQAHDSIDFSQIQNRRR
jgi:hypothetical protein